MKYRVVKDGAVLGEPFEVATPEEAKTKAAFIGAGQGFVTVEIQNGTAWRQVSSINTNTSDSFPELD